MSDNYEILSSIKKEIRAVEKIRQEQFRKINDELEPMIKEIQSRCPHELHEFKQNMYFGYSLRRSCYWCNYSEEIERVT